MDGTRESNTSNDGGMKNKSHGILGKHSIAF